MKKYKNMFCDVVDLELEKFDPDILIEDIKNFLGAGEVWTDESGEIHFSSDD